MSAADDLTQVNILLLAQLLEVLERRQAVEPTEAREQMLDQLQHIRLLRNRLVHGGDVSTEEITQTVPAALALLVQVEKSSLGTPAAQQLRAKVDPEQIADVFHRQDVQVRRVVDHLQGRRAARAATRAAQPAPNPEDAIPGFLTVAEVAGVMRCSKMSVYRLVHSGELPAIRVGRSFRVPEEAVRDYIADMHRDIS